MALLNKVAPVLLAVLALVLAGCSDGGGGGADGAGAGENAPEVQATATTGGIRGVVVDERIVPIKGATVQVSPGNKTIESDPEGLFAISGLEPGDYFVKASHPLYDVAQASTTVVAGESNPKAIKLQLNRVIAANPYKETLQFDGYIACSMDIAGSLFSEECGEGVGVPCGVPMFGCQRVGGQANNNVQFDFYPSVDLPKSILVELNWDPTIGAVTTGALWTVVETEFVCDPTCHGKNVMNSDDEHFGNCATSPSYIREDEHVQTLNLTATTMISTFTWACGNGGTVPYDLELNQQFQEFVTLSYYLPLPEGWSFVNNDPDPFT
ncbi:MAG: carboxypeptidase-like regulatory domain-containing protein [Candidatus Thermoplasmatota archaeon]